MADDDQQDSPFIGGVPEAAAYLGLSTKTVRRYVQSGRLQSYRVGRRRLAFKRHDLQALIVAVQALRHQDADD